MTFEETIRLVVRDAVREALAGHDAQTCAPAPSLPRYLSTDEAAKVAGVTAEAVRDWVKAGRLPRHQAGRLLRVRLDELEAFMRAPQGDPGRLDLEAKATSIVAATRRV